MLAMRLYEIFSKINKVLFLPKKVTLSFENIIFCEFFNTNIKGTLRLPEFQFLSLFSFFFPIEFCCLCRIELIYILAQSLFNRLSLINNKATGLPLRDVVLVFTEILKG